MVLVSKIAESLRSVLEETGLYHARTVLYESPVYSSLFTQWTQHWPNSLTSNCDRCAEVGPTTFVKVDAVPIESRTRHSTLKYRCARCESTELLFVVRTEILTETRKNAEGLGDQTLCILGLRLTKIGQDPARSIEPPNALKKLLAPPDVKLLKMAIVCIEHGFGVGALAYMRRVVEDSVALLLSLLRQSAELDSDTELVAKIEDAQKSFPAAERLKLAADLLPAYLRPGGLNPLDQLYRVCSAGLHTGSDEDALDDAKATRQMFEIVMTRVRQHIDDTKNAHATIQSLAKRLPERK